MGKRQTRTITAEEFASWRDDPVTQWVCGELAKAAEAQKAAWVEFTWDSGEISPVLRAELRTRADAYSALAEMTYEDLAEMSA